MITLKQISIKNCPYYFFSDMIYLLSIDKISFKSIDAVTYYIKYIGNGYIEKNNGDKYLIFVSTDKNKEIFKKYTKHWDEIKNQIEK